MALEPEGGGAGEAQHHGLAACGRYPLLDTLAHELGAVAVGKDQSRFSRDDLVGKIGRDGEIEPVAEIEIVLPLRIGPIVDEARLDLDDQHIA